MELTAHWAAFVCWVDDQIDRRGLGSVPGELERFTTSLRRVLTCDAATSAADAPQAVVLAWLWERTAAGMSDRWRKRFTADYRDFLDACEEEVAARRSGTRLPLADYVELRRRTITLLPMLNVLERTGHAHLVEDPLVDAQLRDLRWALADVAGWANDLASQVQDAAAGQDNLVSLIARRDDCPTDQARARVAAMIEQRRAEFRATALALRTTPLCRSLSCGNCGATSTWWRRSWPRPCTGWRAPDASPSTTSPRIAARSLPQRMRSAPTRLGGSPGPTVSGAGSDETRPDPREPAPLAARRVPHRPGGGHHQAAQPP